MALVVEDGTGKATAESYVSVADFQTYAENRNYSIDSYTDEQIEQAARRAVVYIDNRRFRGRPTQGRDQALQWPRYNVTDGQGFVIASTEVPREVVSAMCEAIYRELVTPNSLLPDRERGGQVIRERKRVEGVVEKETEWASGASVSTTISIIESLLRDLVLTGVPLLRI